VYDIAVTVRACLAAETHVDVAWAVEGNGSGPVDVSEALAITPGGGRVGSVLSGALDDQLVARVPTDGTGRFVHLQVGEVDALVAGLPGAGSARCLLVPADALPPGLWDRLVERQPVCLVARVDGDRVVGTELYDERTVGGIVGGAGQSAARLFADRTSAARVEGDTVVTVLWPVPKLVVAGGGPLAEALSDAAALLCWQVQVFTDPAAAVAHITGLSVLDNLVVVGHDDQLTGSALMAGLAGPVGYIGGVGPRRLQESRRDWLVTRGVNDLSRIHGPAGLDVGAATPAEIAVSVLAEALAVRSARATATVEHATRHRSKEADDEPA
jgi:xanthine dehydrogenase accessory factor